MSTVRIHSLETLGTLDGPGLRTVVFLQGCHLRCRFCHNPDSWAPDGGTATDIEQLVARLKRMKPYFGAQGGVTFSGGDPLCQPQALAEILQRCRHEHIHTAIDTSGAFWNDDIQNVAAMADMLLLDLKGTTRETFRQHTGCDAFHQLRRILDYLKTSRQPAWLRMVVAQNLNASDDDLQALLPLLQDVPFQRFDILPYHRGAQEKYRALHLPFDESIIPPDDALIHKITRFIQQHFPLTT